ncbi:hypothetical protein M3231_05915 [Neobacillus mesonae]|nr:hypothetical protein [Neobacillus mesonae]
MMKKNKSWILALALSAVVASGALLPASTYAAAVVEGTTESTQNQAEAGSESEVELTADELDFESYLDQLSALAVYEEKAFDAMAGSGVVTNSNRKSLYLKFNNTVVPNYTKYVSKLKQIKPANAELQKIHAKLIRGSYSQLEGYILYKRALSKYTINRTLLNQGNTKVESGKKLIEQYQDEFEAYAAELGYE